MNTPIGLGQAVKTGKACPWRRPGSLGSPNFSLFFAIILIGMPVWVSLLSQETEADFNIIPNLPLSEALAIVQGNSLLPYFTSQAALASEEKTNKIPVIVTAYSSSPWETDKNPYTTAAGTQVRQGVVANNLLPIGTKIRLPELYGDRIFVVEDRMNRRKGAYQVDVWFPSYWEAKSFGIKRTYAEVLD